MKKLSLILLTIVLVNCSNQNTSSGDLTPSVAIDPPAPKDGYEWVFDPEPWVSSEDTSKPNILSIGDSISGGYMPGLIRNFSNYDVRHPLENCRNSFYTLQNIDKWLSDFSNNDIIFWNNGIWDSTTDEWYEQNKDFVQAPKEWYGLTTEQYESNIIQIARKMKATGSRVIFLTTTSLNNSPPFKPGFENKFNEVTKRVLPSEGVEIFDLNSVGKSIPFGNVSPIDVHFTRTASQTLTDAIYSYVINH